MGKAYEVIEEGIQVSVVEDFQATYHVPNRQMALLLGVAEKTYYNVMNQSKLDFDRSDRFLFVKKIFEQGKEALMSEDALMEWLNHPQSFCEGRKPVDLLKSINGAQEVYDQLGRIKYGVHF